MPMPCTNMRLQLLLTKLTCAIVPFAFPASAALDAFTCQQGGFPEAWPKETQEYCCKIKGIYCGGASAANDRATFNCDEGIRARWHPEKQTWCCANRKKCFVDMGAASDFACQLDRQWELAEIEWCCMYRGQGCDRSIVPACTSEDGCNVTHVSLPYDCASGHETEWTGDKSSWCCTHELECQGFYPNGCTKGWAWAIRRRAWCCRNEPDCEWTWLVLFFGTLLMLGMTMGLCALCTRRKAGAFEPAVLLAGDSHPHESAHSPMFVHMSGTHGAAHKALHAYPLGTSLV